MRDFHGPQRKCRSSFFSLFPILEFNFYHNMEKARKRNTKKYEEIQKYKKKQNKTTIGKSMLELQSVDEYLDVNHDQF
jgi:hypothetical protein